MHQWDYCYKTGVSEYNNEERLHKFSSWIENGAVWVDVDEIAEWEAACCPRSSRATAAISTS